MSGSDATAVRGSAPISSPGNVVDLLVIGDSLSTDPYELGPPYAPPAGTFAGWPDIFRKIGKRVTSIAVSGSVTTQWLSTHLAARFDPLVLPSVSSPRAVFIGLGTNDLRGLLSAADWETNMAAIVAYVLAACQWLSRVGVWTVPPFFNAVNRNSGSNPSYEVQRLAANVWVRSQEATIVPVEVALQLDPTSTGILPAWMDAGDGVHPSASGGIQQVGTYVFAGVQLSPEVA